MSAQILVLGSLAILAGSCGGGGSDMTSPTEPGGSNQVVTVEIVDNAFSPRSVVVQPGQTVRWVLEGTSTIHTVTDAAGVFDSGKIFEKKGDAFEHTFTQADDGKTFQYYCVSHRGCCMMQGSVRVGSNAPAPDPGY